MKIFLDWDNTIYPTVREFVRLYNEMYHDNVDYRTQLDWNFSGCKKLRNEEDVERLFTNPAIYRSYDLKPNCYEVVKSLMNDHKCDVTIVTVGRYKNIVHKMKLIKELFPKVKIVPIIFEGEVKMDKSVINMKDGIFLDDSLGCMRTSNADYKFLFRDKNYQYNKDYNGKSVESWLEFYNEVLKLIDR